MKTEGNMIVLEDSARFTPFTHGVEYTDVSGARVYVPMKLLVRLYEGTKYNFEKKVDWDDFCNSLFEE